MPDELVKDPVCQTYIVKSRAVRRAGAGHIRYFCSEQCARLDPGA
jgi:YHS domain-containing protein